MLSLLVIFVWGGVAILWVLNVVRNRVLNSCRIWSITQLNTTPRPTVSHCLYLLYVYFGREDRGATVHKWSRKYQHDWLYLQSINSIKHQWRWHLGFCVFFVPSSMHGLTEKRRKCNKQKRSRLCMSSLNSTRIGRRTEPAFKEPRNRFRQPMWPGGPVRQIGLLYRLVIDSWAHQNVCIFGLWNNLWNYIWAEKATRARIRIHLRSPEPKFVNF